MMDEKEALSNLLDALRVAEAACRQLGFMRSQSDWIRMGASFGTMRDMCTNLAQAGRGGLILMPKAH